MDETPAPAVGADWRAWIAENLANGSDEALIVEGLVSNGVAVDDASDAVATVMRTVDLDVVAQLVESTRRRQAIIDLQRTLLGHDAIAETDNISATEFYQRHFDVNRPVLIRGFASEWPAVGKWTPEWFASEFGEITIDVCSGRTSDPTPDRNYEQHVVSTTMGDFIAEIMGAGSTNDVYAISNNKLMERAELAGLFDDVRPDPDMFPEAGRVPGSVALWIGPQGTVTPLHHDTTNVMFCQISGSKRISLVSPLETSVADSATDFYAQCDVGSPEWELRFADVLVRTVDVGPGDALFIPVGWWHRIEALSPSISFVLLGFAQPNDFSWYRPGSIRS